LLAPNLFSFVLPQMPHAFGGLNRIG